MSDEIHKRNQIKDIVSELTTKWGGYGNIALMREAYHGCFPDREFGGDCPAVQIDGNALRFGMVHWNFEQDQEDAADYDWSFSENDFESQEEYDLCVEDDLEDALCELKKWK